MHNPDSLFDTMIKEAMEEVSNHGWREASNNAVTLAAFGMMADKVNRRINRIVKPAWVIALSVGATAVWFIVSKLIGI